MNVNETVAGLTISAKTEGVDQAKKQVDGLTKSTEQLGVVSETSSKGARSLEESWKRATLRFDEGARSQAAFAREAKLAEAAVRSGVASQQQANEHLARVAERYGQASTASKAFAAATSGVSAQLVALSAGAGPVGTFLAALGPWGLAASVGIGAVSAVVDKLSEGAKRVGDKSIEMKKFSDVTGLSVTEIKGLTKAGAELGVSSDDIRTSIERFSVGLNAARKGSGELFEQVNKINPQLARQLAEAKGTAQGWDILAQAIKGATDAAQRNALARAAFGRSGLETGLVAVQTIDKGGVEAMGEQIAKNTGLTKAWVAETARLRAENIALEKQIKNTSDSLFALPMLEFQNTALKVQKSLLEQMTKFGKDFSYAMSQPVFAPTDTFDERFPVSQRGPSEGAMQAQQEAAAQREVTSAIQEANKARDYAVSVDKMLLTIAQESAAAEIRKAAVFAQNAAAYSNVSATTAQTLAALKDQLGIAQAVGVTEQIAAQRRATINQLLREGKSLEDATAIAKAQQEVTEARIVSAHLLRMEALRDQLNIAQQITGLGRINAQYQADINELVRQGLPLHLAIAEASLKRAIALAQVNTQAERQLKNLENEYEVIKARTELEKGLVRARQEYDKLVESGVSGGLAGKIAGQMAANARATEMAREEAEEAAKATQSWSVANDNAGESAQRLAANADDLAYAANRAANSLWNAGQQALLAETAFVPLSTTWAGMSGSGLNVQTWTNASGGLTQFNPAGYTSTTTGIGGVKLSPALTDEERMKAFQYQFDTALTQSGGNLAAGVGGMIARGGIFTGDTTDPQRFALLERAINLMSPEQQIGSYQGLMGQLQAAPQNLQTAELTKQLGDKLTDLTRATDENTSATSAMTDVLSPFYSSDPRRTHLGFRAFAGGGIMTEFGALPLRQYQGGGIATSPQVAVFGEGSTPEAYVPAPGGRIPVEVKMPANSNQRPVQVTINVMGNADAGTVAALKQTSFQKAQQLRRMTG